MPPESYTCEYNLEATGKQYSRSCTVQDVCSLRKQESLQTIANLHYVPKTDSEYYLNNWFIQMDATCATAEELNFIISAGFLGFVLGAFLFPVPDQIGRKKTMTLIVLPYIVTFGMVAYGTNVTVKTFGMFMQGALHLRITLSYTHMYELVREKDKPFCA